MVPGSGPNGPAILKFLNMLLTGTIFVTTAYFARQGTVTTQTTVTELMSTLREYSRTGLWSSPMGDPKSQSVNGKDSSNDEAEIVVPLVRRDADSVATTDTNITSSTVGKKIDVV